MIYFLLITSLSVSIDSFFCGLSLSMLKATKRKIVSVIAFTVFIMCFITNYSAKYLGKFLPDDIASYGGLILIFIGLMNLFKSNNENNQINNNKQTFAIGFAVGLDGCMANLSLSLMGLNAIYVPITIAIMHAIMIYLGIVLSKVEVFLNARYTNIIPSIVLISLGIYKLSALL